VGTAYAHERSGDTMASVMIGGITTVLNGAFPMQTGDRVMWYLTAAESKMFNMQGAREPINTTERKEKENEDRNIANQGMYEQEKENYRVARAAGHHPDKPKLHVVWDGVSNPMKAQGYGKDQFPHLTWNNVQKYVAKVRTRSERHNHRSGVGTNISKSMYMKQKNGLENKDGNTHKKDVALIKPFFYKHASDGDYERVFAVCLSPAAPFEMVDIMISRQSL
jgi:hypothetical protein